MFGMKYKQGDFVLARRNDIGNELFLTLTNKYLMYDLKNDNIVNSINLSMERTKILTISVEISLNLIPD